MSEELRELIRKLVVIRKGMGLSQTEIARRMCVSPATVAQFERPSRSRDMYISSVLRYCEALGLRLTFHTDFGGGS